MVVFKREEFKDNPGLQKLVKAIVAEHTIPEYTLKSLKELNDSMFMQEARHYIILELKGKGPKYLHYDTETWLNENKLGCNLRISEIAVYDDYAEYETTRRKALDKVSPDEKEDPNLN